MSHVRISYETFQKTAPGAQAALLAMGKSTEESGLDKSLVELVKLRVSQTNNCAFCLQIHLNVSRRLGVPQEKLDLVATWHEAGIRHPRGYFRLIFGLMNWLETRSDGLRPASVGLPCAV